MKKDPTNILGYNLINTSKFERAIYGTMGHGGTLVGGVGEAATNEAVIAEYDRLGGLIKKGKNKVKTGSFYDFENKKPRPKPDVMLLFRDLEGNEVAIGLDEEIPVELQAADLISEKKRIKQLADADKKAEQKEKTKKAIAKPTNEEE